MTALDQPCVTWQPSTVFDDKAIWSTTTAQNSRARSFHPGRSYTNPSSITLPHRTIIKRTQIAISHSSDSVRPENEDTWTSGNCGVSFVTVVSSSSRDCGNHVTIKRGTAKGTYVGRGPSKTCSCPYHRRASSTLPCLGAIAFRKSDGKWKCSRRQHTWLTLYGVVTPRRTNILAGERDRVAGDRCTAANRPGTHAAGGQTAGNATGATHACRDIDVAARHPDL